MDKFLDAIGSVSGPLTLLAFLAVVFLAIFMRSVKDEKGLEYIYNLFQSKLSKDHFYELARDLLKRLFSFLTVVFIASLTAFVLVKVFGKPEVGDGDIVSGGLGDDVVITRSERIYIDGKAVPRLPGNAVDGGSGNDLIVTDPQSEGFPQPNTWDRLDAAERLHPDYSIKVSWGARSTAELRKFYALQPMNLDTDDARLEEDGIPFDEVPNGVFGFTTGFTLGRATRKDTFFFPTPAGSVTMEVHKRANGSLAVAGFVSAEQGGALSDPARNKPVTVTLYAVPQPDAGAAASIPLARVESIIVGKMHQPFGVDAVDFAVW